MAKKTNLVLNSQDYQKVDEFRQSCDTAILTILFTDIVGFTDLADTYGDVVSNQIRHIHDELFTTLIQETKSAEIIKQIGDSFLSVFAEPTTAVQVALEFQKRIDENIQTLSYERYVLKARIGIHLGQVTIENSFGEDIFGYQVNKASRIMRVARGGQILITDSVKDNLATWIKSQKKKAIKLKSYGRLKLKGIKEKAGISQVYYKNKKIKKPSAVKKRNRKIFLGIILSLITMIYFYGKLTEEYNRVYVDVIYNDDKVKQYFSNMVNRNRSDEIKVNFIPDSLGEKINKEFYDKLVKEIRRRKYLQVLTHKDLQNQFDISLRDSISRYFDIKDDISEYHANSSLLKDFVRQLKTNLIIYWLFYYQDESNQQDLTYLWYKLGMVNGMTYNEWNTGASKVNLFEDLDEDIESITANNSITIMQRIKSLYNEIILGRADWYGDGYIQIIFNDSYKIKLLNQYNVKVGMKLRVKKYFQLNKPSERKEYIQFLKYNIHYIDSMKQVEPNKWNYVLRGYKNDLDDYNEEDYIGIGNQYVQIPQCGNIILKIEEIFNDYAIATLVKKEYPWINLEKEDKVIFE